MSTTDFILGFNLLLSAIFLFAIHAKLLGVQKSKFKRWGFAPWFRYFVAVLEIVALIGLFIPSLRIPAWMLLTTIIVGALITLLRSQEEGNKFILPLVSLLLLIGYFILLRSV